MIESMLAYQKAHQAALPTVPQRLMPLFMQSLYTYAFRYSQVQALPTPQDGLLVDLGGGTGALSLMLAARFPHCTVLCLDRDEEALQVAENMATSLGLPNFTAVLDDVFVLPTHDTKFSMITARYLLQHIENPLTLLQQWTMQLKPNGLLVAIDIDDGGSLHYPPLAASIQHAYLQYAKEQRGDRQVGRKLYNYFQTIELQKIQVFPYPRVELGQLSSSSRELEQSYLKTRPEDYDEIPRLRMNLEFLAYGLAKG